MSDDSDRSTPKPQPVDRLSALWSRINERKIVQWSIAYVALAYGIQHGVVLTEDAFEWPHAIQQLSMLLLAFGLPVVMVFAWYHGERASRRISGPELTIIALLLAIGSLFFYVLVQPAQDIAARAPTARQSGVAAARDAAASPKTAISLAVLPFVNLSSDKEQEFFSDGMTEEITAALAKVPDLRVVGRTSAFQFKGQNQDLRSIGQSLAATHLIEGSVRKEGNRVRITAQLIKSDDGTHIWSENYDRQLTDIFAVQEDIARAIITALRMPLGLKEGQNLVSNRIADTGSYQDYLRARALVRSRIAATPGEPLIEAAKLLEQVVARDPDYAPAWGMLAQAYAAIPSISAVLVTGSADEKRHIAELLQKAEAAGQHAIRLDPGHPDGYTALGYARNYRGQFVQAEDSFKQALSLDPENPEALFLYSNMLAVVGRLKDSLALHLRLKELEPFVPIFNGATGGALWLSGRNDEAIAIFKASKVTGQRIALAEVYASMGRYSEAADALREIPPGNFAPGAIEEAVRLLRTAPAQTRSPPAILSGTGLVWVSLYVGAPDQVLDGFEDLAEKTGFFGGPGTSTLWAPSYAPVRKTERFKAYMRKTGKVDYWKARGWPDLCHPTTGEDFVCE